MRSKIAPDIPEEKASNNYSKKILLVDSREELYYLNDILREAYYEVTFTTSGKEAIEFAIKQHPDLIILEIVMPDMTGDEVAAILKKDYHTAKIPIVFVTDILTKDEEKMLGGMTGDYHIIAKPIMPEDLLSVINEVI